MSVPALEPPLAEEWHGRVTMSYPPSAQSLWISKKLVILSDRRRRLLALDEESQELRWAYDLPAVPRLAHEGRVFAWPVDHELHVLNGRSGELEHVVFCPEPERAEITGRYLVGTAFEPEYGDNILYVVDWRSGRRRWSRRPGDRSMSSHFAIAGPRVIVGYDGARLLGIDIRSGKTDWEKQFVGLEEETLDDVPAVLDDRVIVRLGATMLALSLEDDREIWRREKTVSLASDGAKLFVEGPGGFGSLEPKSGKIVPAFRRLGALPYKLPYSTYLYERGPYLLTRTHLFVCGHQEHLIAFDRKSGKFAWGYRINERYGNEPGEIIYANDRLYFATGCMVACFVPEATAADTSHVRTRRK